jgi:hypothetical protein
MIKAALRKDADYWQSAILILYGLLAIVVCFQLLHSQSNNFIIFTQSSRHLLQGLPLYQLYPLEYDDYFLYHPAFAVLFLPFSYLPYSIGICTWTLLSTLLLVTAVRTIPTLASREKNLVFLFILPEFINNLQYAQTNVVLLALMVLTYSSFEKNRWLQAGLFTALCFCIKGYGGIVGLLFIFYPNKWKYLLSAGISTIIICLLPMIATNAGGLINLYTDWLKMIGSDEIRESMSLIGLARNWGITESVMSIFGGLLLIVFAWANLLAGRFNKGLLLLSWLLLWVVLFNRAAESPTYLLAATGAALWLAAIRFTGNWLWISLAFVLVVYVTDSDLFPAFHQYFYDNQLKVFAYLLPLLVLLCYVFPPTKPALREPNRPEN